MHYPTQEQIKAQNCTLTLRLMNLTLVSSTKVTLHTCHALPKNKTKFKISKIILLYKNLVIGHHLFLHKSPFNVTVTHYINSDIRELDHHVLHWGDFTHVSCIVPPYPRTIKSLKFLKLLCCAESL